MQALAKLEPLEIFSLALDKQLVATCLRAAIYRQIHTDFGYEIAEKKQQFCLVKIFLCRVETLSRSITQILTLTLL